MGLAGAVVLAVAPAAAQQVGMVTSPPAQEFEVVAPGGHYERTRPSDADFYPPPGPRVQYDPAFIEPFAAKRETPTSTGRVGLAGWTSPNTPVGSPQTGSRDVSGWFALGFAITWDGPSPTAVRRPVR
jgi:hypothetical protein